MGPDGEPGRGGPDTMTSQAWAPRIAAAASGTHIPFTAPLLAGARGRLLRRSLDFILPNPSGGRGTYVVTWAQASALAAPTLHDTVLARRLHEMTSLTPPAVRRAARAVAAEGYAGREAADAASRAQTRIEAERLRLWAKFLRALIQHSDLPIGEQGRILAGLGTAGPGIVTDGFVAVAQLLGWKPAVLAEALDQLSDAYLAAAPGGRAERLMAMLAAMHPALMAEQAQTARTAQDGLSPALLARTVGSIGHWLVHAQAILDEAARALADAAGLLDRWRLDPVAATEAVRAVEEALDGWDRICLLWTEADTLSARLGLLPEIGLLVRLASSPAGETEAVAASQPGAPEPVQARPIPEGARKAAPNLVQRNERIRACELALEHGDG